MDYKFREGVPAPPARRQQNNAWVHAIKVGQSLAFSTSAIASARVAAAKKKRAQRGWDYVSRQNPDGSVTIWRTA